MSQGNEPHLRFETTSLYIHCSIPGVYLSLVLATLGVYSEQVFIWRNTNETYYSNIHACSLLLQTNRSFNIKFNKFAMIGWMKDCPDINFCGQFGLQLAVLMHHTHEKY